MIIVREEENDNGRAMWSVGRDDSYPPEDGDLRVHWIPQVPAGKEGPFIVPVKTPEEGSTVMRILADYDLYQLKANIKPDYSSAGDLEVFDGEDGWTTWYDGDGYNIDELEVVDGKLVCSQDLEDE